MNGLRTLVARIARAVSEAINKIDNVDTAIAQPRVRGREGSVRTVDSIGIGTGYVADTLVGVRAWKVRA